MLIDDPSGTAVSKKATVDQLLVDVARTDESNTFTGDQTVDGDLFVTGEVNPARLAEQKAKIDRLTLPVGGDPAGSRTLMSRSLVSGLSIRHDEDLAQGRVAVGDYDAQLYQPLLFEAESLRIQTGLVPGTAAEHVRVHPSGGVTVGTVHTDPGVGVVQAGGLGTTPLNASALTGTVPDARLSANVQMKPIALGDLPANVATKPIPQSDVTNLVSDLAAKGTGNVVGPASAGGAGSVAAFADTTGKLLMDAGFSYTTVARTNTANIFSTNQTINKATPVVQLQDSAQAANARRFDVINSALTMKIAAVNDAGTVLFTPLTLDRSGNVTGTGHTDCHGWAGHDGAQCDQPDQWHRACGTPHGGESPRPCVPPSDWRSGCDCARYAGCADGHHDTECVHDGAWPVAKIIERRRSVP